jgi:hypothetical protein
MQSPAPLDDAQVAVLETTRNIQRKLRFAGFIALSNVCALGFFAVISVLFALLDLSVPVVGLALGALAWNEARGWRGLRAGDPAASKRLALNQLLLLATVIIYCAVSAYQGYTGPSPLDAVMGADPSLPDALGQAASDVGTSMDELTQWGRVAALIIYGIVAVASVIVQGLTAVYYRSLGPSLEALASTPAWARALS